MFTHLTVEEVHTIELLVPQGNVKVPKRNVEVSVTHEQSAPERNVEVSVTHGKSICRFYIIVVQPGNFFMWK